MHYRYFYHVFIVALLFAAAGCENGQSPTAGADSSDEVEAGKTPPSGQQGDQGVSMGELMASARQKETSEALPPGHPPIDGSAVQEPYLPPEATSDTPPKPGGMMGGGAKPGGMMGGGATLPAGHPPIGQAAGGESGLPAGHPPIGQVSGDNAPPAASQEMLELNPPASWEVQPARRMTVAVYELPAAEGSEPAELAVSYFPGMKDVPMESQVRRWAGQFRQPADAPPGQAVKQTPLEDAAHPTTLIDITGEYLGSSMMGGESAPKADHQMLVGYVETDKGPWFFKLVGPQSTVEKHREEFLKFLRDAK